MKLKGIVGAGSSCSCATWFELLPFVILNGFCLCIDSAHAVKSTCTAAFDETS